MKRRALPRGFTLVELLMATTAGLIVSAAAFLLAKNAASVFQEETRITGAQLSASLGLQRLATDLSRAGFLTSARPAADPFVCQEVATWPLLLTNLRAVKIEEGGSVTANPAALAQSVANGFNPDRIEIASSLGSAELFPVRTIQDGSTGKVIHLQTDSYPIARTCQGKTIVDCQPTLERIFKPDRLLRLLTTSGHQIYGLISSLDVQPTSVRVELQGTPIVPPVAVNPKGYPGDCRGCFANVISVVRYELQSLQGHPQYGALVAPLAQSATGDGGRTELVRVELDREGNALPNSLELVAEFAVDLKFGISSVDPATSAVTDVPLTLPANPLVYTTPPERIRSVHVRLSTRARAPDREVDLPPGMDGRKHRFALPLLGKLKYARMRTLYTEVALQNLARATW